MKRRHVTALLGLGAMVVASCSGSDDSADLDVSATFATVAPAAAEPAGSEPSSTLPDTSPDTSPAPTVTDASTTTTEPAPGPLVDPSVALVEIGQFNQPVDVAIRPSDPRLFVVEQSGQVLAVDDESNEVMLDVSDRITNGGSEQGLLGLAFHPALPLAYVDYTDNDGDTVVAEFAVDTATGMFDPASFREVLNIDQPFENHNGGKLEFGPDGYLYIGLGDGGSGGDPNRDALDLTSRLGKILRIDPAASGTEAFTVPTDNPFVGIDGADPTIWALGLRNPWRFAFDAANGDLWIADVGQNEFEEINHAPAADRANAGRGLSFGWSAIEGFTEFNGDQPADNHTAPVYVYDHGDGRCSVSGGAVARGDTVANLAGWYIFGDYCTGEIWAFDPASPADAPRIVTIANLPGLAAISVGPERELYAISNAGTIARLANP
jgi:glucose/arabinose dehydrogenase